VRLLVTDPSDGFSRLRPDGDITSPILFGLLLSWASVFLSQVWRLMFRGAIRGVFHAFPGFGDRYVPSGVFGLVGLIVIWPVIFIAGLFIAAGIVHLCLMLVGATNDSPSGFEGTLKVYAYSQVAGIATIVPLFGGIVVIIWAVVLEVIGFALVHRTTQSRALMGVLIPLVVCCACAVVGIAALGASIAAFIASMSGHGGS
jgi:Yip1 domain